MKLYTLTDASSVVAEVPVRDDDGETQLKAKTFEVDEDGSVEVPHELGELLHRTHIGGAKAWETEPERHARLVAEELARRKDPASLLAAVEALTEKVAAQPAKRAPRAPKSASNE